VTGKFRFVFCLLAGLLVNIAQAETVRPLPGDGELNLGPHVDILEDPDGSLTVQQVSGSFADRFMPATTQNPSFGFTRSTYWLRFTLDMSAVVGQRWYLVQRHPIIDHLTLYAPVEEEVFAATEMGDALPFGERVLEHREFVFPLDTRTQGQRTYYMKVSGKGALSLELKLSSADGLIERTYLEQLVFGLFYGALLVMLVYNLVLYLSVRDIAYLWYILFLGAFILCFVNINGLGLQYLWRNMPRLNEGYPVFAVFGMLALVQYSRAFLDLANQHAGYERYLQRVLYAFIAALLAAFVLPAPWSYHLSTVVVLVTVLSLNWIGIGIWRRGYRAARFYVAAWSLFMFGLFVFFLDNVGWIPHTGLSNYSPHIGSAWAVVLLSLALGERIKILEAERDALERRNHETLQRHFEEVQRLDRDKMVFLEYLSHELNTPLNWLASAQMLEAGKLPRELEEAVDMVHKGQDRLQGLVSVSLRYFELSSRQQLPELTPCAPMWKLDRLLREESRAALMAERVIRLINRIPADLCVEASDAELSEVLAILLDNAIQFSEDGSEVRAEARFEDDGGHVVLCIADGGRGIAAEALQSIFEPFFMVGSNHRIDGFGLSLPTARVMIEQIGGQIWAESAGRGRGACLCIRLRAAAG